MIIPVYRGLYQCWEKAKEETRMIQINYDKFTIECTTLEDAVKKIEEFKVPLQEATIKMRVKVPGIAFEAIVNDVQGSGGVVL